MSSKFKELEKAYKNINDCIKGIKKDFKNYKFYINRAAGYIKIISIIESGHNKDKYKERIINLLLVFSEEIEMETGLNAGKEIKEQYNKLYSEV